LRRELDDLLALRGDVVLIPIEEDQEHLLRWRRRRCRPQWGVGWWRRAELHRHAGEDVVRMIAGGVLAAAATVGPPVAVRKRVPSRVGEGRIGGPQVTKVEIEGNRRAKVVADPPDRLIPKYPAA